MRSSAKEILIKNAAMLFSRSGYNAVSMRDVAKASGVNVGSLTYHFGSKANLLREIYARHTLPMNARRLELLGEARRISNLDERLMAILRAYIVPAFVSSSDGDGGGAEFTRMRAVLSAEGNADAKAIIADAFDQTSRSFIEALAECVPGASRESVVWRSQFLLGGLYYALINPERITRLSDGAVDGNDRNAAVDQLVEATYASFKSLTLPSSEGGNQDREMTTET